MYEAKLRALCWGFGATVDCTILIRLLDDPVINCRAGTNLDYSFIDVLFVSASEVPKYRPASKYQVSKS